MNDPVVHLFLVRHAESHWNVEGRYQGQSDSGLTRSGHEQARAFGEWAPASLPPIDLIVTSDLQRVVDTAHPAASALGLEPLVDPRLREVDIGSWSGRTFDDVAVEEPAAVADFAAGIDIPRGGGETFSMTRTRAVDALDDVVAAIPSASEVAHVLVFTHGGPIRVASAAAVGAPDPGHWDLGPPANCSLTHIEQRGSRGRLLRYNWLPSIATSDQAPAPTPGNELV